MNRDTIANLDRRADRLAAVGHLGGAKMAGLQHLDRKAEAVTRLLADFDRRAVRLGRLLAAFEGAGDR
jgi:hypothetical protein